MVAMTAQPRNVYDALPRSHRKQFRAEYDQALDAAHNPRASSRCELCSSSGPYEPSPTSVPATKRPSRAP
ncbi:DUF6247 family protein [Spirillospora sp. NPDC046719]